MRVAELWRYPVKSLQGERLDSVAVTAEGLEGDRRFAIHDTQTGLGLTARREPRLLFASARMIDGDREVEVTLPDGSVTRDDAALSQWLGRAVRLERAGGGVALRYENPVDFEDESGIWTRFGGADGPFHDSAAARVTLLSRATIGAWDRRRFRPTCCSTATARTASQAQRHRRPFATHRANSGSTRRCRVGRS
jgi:uncharacterized protein YcbX